MWGAGEHGEGLPSSRDLGIGPSKLYFLDLFILTAPSTSLQSNQVLTPYPEAGTVRVGTNEAEAIARNILTPHSKSNDGGRVSG